MSYASISVEALDFNHKISLHLWSTDWCGLAFPVSFYEDGCSSSGECRWMARWNDAHRPKSIRSMPVSGDMRHTQTWCFTWKVERQWGFFGKHQSQLSEILWEGLEHFVEHRGKLITGDISSALIDIRAPEYANSVFEKVGALPNCVGFIDGTVIGVSRPGV
jgi:hypothetical protein